MIGLFALVATVALLLGGCASYDGRGLIPGRSTQAEVEALMGLPAERRVMPDGGSLPLAQSDVC